MTKHEGPKHRAELRELLVVRFQLQLSQPYLYLLLGQRQSKSRLVEAAWEIVNHSRHPPPFNNYSLDFRESIPPMQFVIESACAAEILSSAIPSPKESFTGATAATGERTGSAVGVIGC